MVAFARRFLSLLLLCLGAAALPAPDDILVVPAPNLTVGQPLTVLLGENPYAEQDCALLLYDAYARLVGYEPLPPPRPVDDDAPSFNPYGEFRFRTNGLAPGELTLKFALRAAATDPYLVRQVLKINLQPPTDAPPPATAFNPVLPSPPARWAPARPLLFWRATPLAVETREDWVRLLDDTGLSATQSPCDGPTLVLPRGTVLSSRMIATEIESVLNNRGLVICETWPTPSLDDAIDLSTIVSPTAPVVKLPDIRPIARLTGLDGPAILSDPDPADWLDRDRQTRLLARRDPQFHRLYGLVEQSFCCLTTRLKPTSGTVALRYAADGSPAVTLRLLPQGGAVLVLNAAVEGYAAAAQEPARAVDFLGVNSAYSRQLLAGARGGVALRAALADVRRQLAARPKTVDETGPCFRLNNDLRIGRDRTVFFVAHLANTRRSLPIWSPPAAIPVQLWCHGELQQSAVMTFRNGRYSATFRIPLETPGEDWLLRYTDPFQEQSVQMKFDLPNLPAFSVIDAPAQP